jgi:hypothetical protein
MKVSQIVSQAGETTGGSRFETNVLSRTGKKEGQMAAIQIQAEILRRYEARTLRRPIAGFALLPEDPATGSGESEQRRRTEWQKADLKRAIEVAKEAGLQSFRVEIAPDGTISLVVGDQA